MLLQRKVGFVIKQAVKNEGSIPISAFNWHAVIRSIVISDEGIEFEGKVAETGAVGLLQHLPAHRKPLPVAGRRSSLAPIKRGVETGDSVHERRQGSALRFLRQLPVAHALELLVRNPFDEFRHCPKADVAAVG